MRCVDISYLFKENILGYAEVLLNMVLNKFCCCLDLHVGAILISVFQIVSGLLPLIKWTVWVNIVIAIVLVASGKCLLYGTIRRYPTTMFVSLFLSMVGIIFYIVAVIMAIIILKNLDINGPNFAEIAAEDIAYAILTISMFECIFLHLYLQFAYADQERIKYFMKISTIFTDEKILPFKLKWFLLRHLNFI